jgi:hypothetical protein
MMLADCLARKLGYRNIDRDAIVEKAAAYGVSQEALRTALEQPPKFFGQSKHTRYVYLALIQAALTQEVWNGAAVYHGLAGHLLLAGIPHVLRTRIIAPMEFRIRMVEQRLKLPRTEAIAYIEKTDQDRRRWTHFLYGVNWDDPALYDIVLSLERMSIEEACETVCAMTRQAAFQITPECQQAMDDVALASRIRANMAIDPATSDLELEVAAHSGSVTVRGELLSAHQANDIRRIARAVPGVHSVHLNELAVVASRF